jgi:hypothetical protein
VYTPPIYVDDVLKGRLQRIGGPIDVSGGWFDAGDYLKFVNTAGYVDAMVISALLFAHCLPDNKPTASGLPTREEAIREQLGDIPRTDPRIKKSIAE